MLETATHRTTALQKGLLDAMSQPPKDDPVELRLRAAVESSPSGLLMIDAKGVIVLVNRQVEILFGYSREELLGKSVDMLVPERFRHHHAGFRAGYVADPRIRAMGHGRDLYGLRRDGTEVPVEIGLNPVITNEGMFVISSIVDISERKLALAALRESEERFRLLVGGVRDYAIFMLNPEGTIVSWNEGAERIIGHKEEEIVGQHFAAIYPREDAHKAAVHLEITRELGSLEEEGWRIRSDGTLFVANVITTALRDEQGRLRGFAEVTRDITERRRLEDQLRQAQKMEAVGTLAGGIAHDFNNILSAIVGYGELAREQAAGLPAVREDILEILAAADRGKKLVERILAFSRRQEPRRQPMNLGASVEEVIKLLRATLPATIDIRPRIDPNSPRVLADATAIHQILMNLSTNAAHAMPHGGVLEIGVEPFYVRDSVARANPNLHEGPYAMLTARDTGKGIDSATRLRVFEPFFTTKEPGKGTGLGLAMVHTVMREHEGAVTLDSEVGVGTTVKCYFPVLASEGTDVQISTIDAPRGGGERILFVDDEVSLARLGHRRLQALGYTVTHESSSIKALDRFKADPSAFDLIVTDYTMPVITGVDLARAVHQINPGVPVLMVTGFVEELSPEEMAAIGIRKVIRKPVTIENLAEAVHEVLAGG